MAVSRSFSLTGAQVPVLLFITWALPDQLSDNPRTERLVWIPSKLSKDDPLKIEDAWRRLVLSTER
jgi:hypothetical protein